MAHAREQARSRLPPFSNARARPHPGRQHTPAHASLRGRVCLAAPRRKRVALWRAFPSPHASPDLHRTACGSTGPRQAIKNLSYVANVYVTR